MTALSALSSTITIGATWNAQLDITGTDYPPVSQGTTITKRRSNGTRVANASAGGANQLGSFITTVAGSGAATVSLNSYTDILQRSGTLIVRLKGYIIRLLSVVDDSVNGTACTSITVGGAASNACPLEMGAGSFTFNVKNGGVHAHTDDSAEGMVAVSAGACNVKFLNNDTVGAAVQSTFIGATT